MDIEEKISTIKGITEEIIAEDELRRLFEEKANPVAYDGFEPSGLAHLPLGVYRPLILKEMLKTGFKFKLLLADSFAWINNKFGGDLEKIRTAGEYFIEVWKAAGIDMDKVEVVWHKDFFDDPEYWRKVIMIAKAHDLDRTKKCLEIAGRNETDKKETAYLFYPSMQCADIFHLDVDVCQLGMDQRKINMLARELGGKLFGKKPIVISHHMLTGLGGTEKMSKSKPDTSIFVHDSKEMIMNKVSKAFCPPIKDKNPMLEYSKEIIFRAFDEFVIERESKFGGEVTFKTYPDLEAAYLNGELHPSDFKRGVAVHLDMLIEPIRKHFESGRPAKLLEELKAFEITR